MAKTLATLDGKLVNYANVVTVYVALGDYTDDEGDGESNVYGLVALDVNSCIHVLGVYEDKHKADEAERKVREWLDRETFGVCDLNADGGD